MATHQIVTLADADTVKIIVSIVIGALWLIGQFMSGRDQGKRRPPQPKPRRVPPPQQGAAAVGQGKIPPAKPKSLENALRREVDDFLRRAQGEPVAKEQEQRPKRPQLKPLSDSVQRTAQRPKSDAAPLRPLGGRLPSAKAPTPAAAQMPSAKSSIGASGAASPWGSNVAEHVAEHLGGDRIAEHAEQLGEDVALADERMEEHLHSVFDHQLGSFASQQAQPQKAPRPPRIAEEVAEMIRTPGGMRQLIIANEILRRPGDSL